MGCVKHLETVRTEIVKPPAALLVPCEKPVPGEMRTNGDLARYASALKYALDTCAARIDALNVFFEARGGSGTSQSGATRQLKGRRP